MNYTNVAKTVKIIMELNLPIDISQISVGGLDSDLKGLEVIGECNNKEISLKKRNFSIENISDNSSFNCPGILNMNVKLSDLPKYVINELMSLGIVIDFTNNKFICLNEFFNFLNKKVSVSLVHKTIELSEIGELGKSNRAKFFKMAYLFELEEDLQSSSVHYYGIMKHAGLLTDYEEYLVSRFNSNLQYTYGQEKVWIENTFNNISADLSALDRFEITITGNSGLITSAKVDKETMEKIRRIIIGSKEPKIDPFATTKIM